MGSGTGDPSVHEEKEATAAELACWGTLIAPGHQSKAPVQLLRIKVLRI